MIIKAFVRFRLKVDDIIKVMPQEPELLLDVSTLLVPTLQRPCCNWTCLHLDCYGQQEQVLFLEVSTPQRPQLHNGRVYTTGA
jgi:hypothetical protein